MKGRKEKKALLLTLGVVVILAGLAVECSGDMGDENFLASTGQGTLKYPISVSESTKYGQLIPNKNEHL